MLKQFLVQAAWWVIRRYDKEHRKETRRLLAETVDVVSPTGHPFLLKDMPIKEFEW